jgi:glycosyltransferase involved in cell wall biosynthesis
VTLPLVSIITPTLNQGQFLEDTLRSVMAQRHPRVEHIVIDGGSTDGSIDLLREYEQRYELAWATGPDSGMYDAINRGFAMAQGDVLTYLNSDDLILPWTVECAVRALSSSGAGVVFGDVVKVDETDGSLQLVFAPPFHPDYLLYLGSLFQPAVFWRRSVLDSAGQFDERLGFGGDLDFWLRAMAHHRLHKVNEVLAVERRHRRAKTYASADAWREEEKRIRRKYARPGDLIRIRRFRQRVRTWVWRRRLWWQFWAASKGRAGGWREFVQACHPRVAAFPFFLAQVPVLGREFVHLVLPTLDPGCLGIADAEDQVLP